MIHVYKDLLELAGPSGAGGVISKLVTFADTVLIVQVFRIPQDETIENTYFLAPFFPSGKLIHRLEISVDKNNLRTP